MSGGVGGLTGAIPSARPDRDEIELVRGASHAFDLEEYLAGRLTPVFFGSALTSFGVQEMLDGFIENAPPPRPCSASGGLAASPAAMLFTASWRL